MKKFLTAGVLFLLSSALSFGALIPSLVPGSPVGNTWVYEVQLAPDSKIDPGQTELTTGGPIWQGFIIYDFAGYVDGSIGATDPTLWEFDVVPTGPVIAPTVGAQADDSPAVNLVFRYIGGPLTGPSFVDTVFADSTYTVPTTDSYQGQGLKNRPLVPTEHNAAQETGGSVTVPAPIPEPAAMGLMGSGLLGLAFLYRRRRS